MTVGLDHTISAHAKRMPVSSAECVSVVAEVRGLAGGPKIGGVLAG